MVTNFILPGAYENCNNISLYEMDNYITRIRDLLPIKWRFPKEKKKVRGEITEEELLVRIASGSGTLPS